MEGGKALTSPTSGTRRLTEATLSSRAGYFQTMLGWRRAKAIGPKLPLSSRPGFEPLCGQIFPGLKSTSVVTMRTLERKRIGRSRSASR